MTKTKCSLLEVIPCRSAHITTIEEGGEIVLSFPRFKRPWMRRLLLPKGMSPDFHVRLEEHGAAVWLLIDGQRTVNDIIHLLAGHFQPGEAFASRVTTYVMQLHKDGMLQLKTRD